VVVDEAAEKLKREKAGTYRTTDGRFTVEQSSSGWLLLDAEQANELGLPLARGPFATLDEARAAIGDARSGPAPTASAPSRASTARPAPDDRDPAPARPTKRTTKAAPARAAAERPARPPVVIRELRGVDGEQLRKLWLEAGFRSLGDDDLSLARMARRNPGLLLVAAEGSRIVGSALGAWDGRRGWIYHVATAETHRRQGIAARLVDRIETGLRDLGCPKVTVLVRDDNDDGREFWVARGYEAGARQYARELRDG
jgi:ribosomal protein S18 acetylase RimI-like enzyme